MVLLYFVRGWSLEDIARRFHMPKHRVWKSLNAWSVRALALGYVQVIDPEAFAAQCRMERELGIIRDNEDIWPADTRSVVKIVPRPLRGYASGTEAARRGTTDETRPYAPVESIKSLDLTAALEVAIARCDESQDEFWVLAAKLLRGLSAAASASSKNSPQQGLCVRAEERVSHAVA